MKTVNIDAARPFLETEIIPDVTRISIRRRAKPISIELAVKRNKRQAKELYEALVVCLPAGALEAFRALVMEGK